MEQLSAGLYVMAVGMAIVFGALIIIMVVMIALERIFRENEDAGDEVIAAAIPSTGVPGGEPTSSPAGDEFVAAGSASAAAAGAPLAAAIAMAYARARAKNGMAYPATSLPPSLDNVEDDRWDWVWDEGVDDYGTTRYSHYASV